MKIVLLLLLIVEPLLPLHSSSSLPWLPIAVAPNEAAARAVKRDFAIPSQFEAEQKLEDTVNNKTRFVLPTYLSPTA